MGKPFYKKLWFNVLSSLVIFVAVILIIAAVSLSQSKTASEIPAKSITLPTEIKSGEYTDAETTAQLYATLATEVKDTLPSPKNPTETYPIEIDYILNKNTKKFHLPTCASAKKIKDTNREDFFGTREQIISEGYSPCGHCKP